MDRKQPSPGALCIVNAYDGRRLLATFIREERTVAGPKWILQSGSLLIKIGPEQVKHEHLPCTGSR